jgi:(2Fe-2S) ferredoxin
LNEHYKGSAIKGKRIRTMEKPEKHIFVCASFRTSGEPKGVCYNKGAVDLLPYLAAEIADRGLDGVTVSSTGCLNVCDRGPAMVIYPENTWYGGIDGEDAVDAVLDALEDGTVAEEYELK